MGECIAYGVEEVERTRGLAREELSLLHDILVKIELLYDGSLFRRIASCRDGVWTGLGMGYAFECMLYIELERSNVYERQAYIFSFGSATDEEGFQRITTR